LLEKVERQREAGTAAFAPGGAVRLRGNRPAETEKARRGARGFENRDWCLVAASAASLTVAGNRMTRTQDERGLEAEEKGGAC